ncbi:hypothetical protein [Streptomyces sp. Y1]|uniref:Secreted protein n=1 Tax=Streptomyces sp. Y1 TaxID=3238634 RepID=A0AB39TV62_9ACTN
MRHIKKAAAVAATAAAVAAMVVVPSGSARAASACWSAGVVKFWYNASYCNNSYGAAVHDAGPTWAPSDYLRSNPSWFACRQEIPDHPNGSHVHPYRWLWTVGDDHGLAGWVSDGDVVSETDSVVPC